MGFVLSCMAWYGSKWKLGIICNVGKICNIEKIGEYRENWKYKGCTANKKNGMCKMRKCAKIKENTKYLENKNLGI